MYDHLRITVIMPCYNQAQYLGAALESLQAQSAPRYDVLLLPDKPHDYMVPKWDCIVVDDGSTDNSLAVAQWYASDDDRITVVSRPHRGLAAARNAGLDCATGDFIQFLDADDLLHPEKFAWHLSSIVRHEADVAFCPPFVFRNDDPETAWNPGGKVALPRQDAMLEDLACGINLPIHCYLFSAKLFREPETRFDESLENHEDWECWMRLFAREPKVRATGEAHALYRRHDQAMSMDGEAMRRGFIAAIEKAAHNFAENDVIAVELARTRQRLEAGDYPSTRLAENLDTIPLRRRIGNLLRTVLPEKRVLQIRRMFYGDT